MALSPPVSPEILQKIRDGLDLVCREYNVRILLATEEGSRAWGLDSPDSDFDVKVKQK